MPLIIEGGQVPPRWALEKNSSPAVSAGASQTDGVHLAFINNMPDAALEDTELQFFELLDDASGHVPIYLKLYSLTGVPRGERGEQHLKSFYHSSDELWQSQFDGVIITGTEPRQPNLKDEPYWKALTEVFDWAERNTASTVLSCLAAHAGVLHSDGVGRHRLPDKQFGVVESRKACNHALLHRIPEQVRFPHSRWNEVREDELTSVGYVVLTKSQHAGVDAFVKKKHESLFVHFQGHPEYGVHTLFKEYRRDIKRFLNRERETYPTMPVGYFDAAATCLLEAFQKSAMTDRQADVMAFFPERAVISGLQNGWHSTAACVYRNWLQYLLAGQAKTSMFAMTAAYGNSLKRTAIG
jgi:homoserine O-succinyltransferase